jgi:RNA-binding protein
MQTELTSKQKKFLRGLAHSIKPVVQVGKHGLSDALTQEVDRALASHELLKIKVAGDRDERDEVASALAERLGAEIAGRIGGVVILYRRQDDPDLRQIELPDASP